MALTVKQLVNRHGAFVSAVAALLVGAAIIAIGLLQVGINALSALSMGVSQLALSEAFSAKLVSVLTLAAPFAVGFFLSLWMIAPIAEELRLPHVVTRAVLATGVASTVYFVVLAVIGLVGALTTVVDTASLPGLFDVRGPTVFGALTGALGSAASTLVSTLPLGVLAGVLLWIWRKDHPPRHPLSGLIDEV